MALFDSVPKAVYDREKERADKAEAQVLYLTKQVLSLKKRGFELPGEAKPGRVVPPGPSPEETAMKRMHDETVRSIEEEAAQQISKARGVSLAVARAEVRSLRESALGGSTYDPPVL